MTPIARHAKFSVVKTAAKMNLGAKIAQTIRWRRMRLTERHEPTASRSWYRQNHFQMASAPVPFPPPLTSVLLADLVRRLVTIRRKREPMISHPKVLKNREIPAV